MYLLRLVGRANNQSRFLSLIAQSAVIIPSVELLARWQRDNLYWPLVKDVYRELKEGKGLEMEA